MGELLVSGRVIYKQTRNLIIGDMKIGWNNKLKEQKLKQRDILYFLHLIGHRIDLIWFLQFFIQI